MFASGALPANNVRFDASAMASASDTSFTSNSNIEADRTLDFDGSEDSSDSSESEEEGGIFFGTHTDAESHFLAKLSAETRPSRPSPPRHKRRQSRLVSMIRRDSTEFHRRKTMVFPLPEDQDVEEEKSRSSDDSIQDRYHQEISLLNISPSTFATDLQFSPVASQNPMLNAFASMHALPSSRLKETDEVSESDSTESDMSSENGHTESDKENMELPGPESDQQAEEDQMDSLGLDITRGMREIAIGEVTDDIVLDMGGMKLSDFADADEGGEEELEERSISYDSSEDEVGGPLDSPTVHLAPLPQNTAPSSAGGLVASPLQMKDTTDLDLHSPVMSATNTKTVEESVSSPKAPSTTSSDEELASDLPVSRAAPTLASTSLYSPLRASDSLFRSPSSGRCMSAGQFPHKSPFAMSLDSTKLSTTDMNSPTRTPVLQTITTPATTRTPRQLGPLPTTATPSQIRGDLAPLAERNSKVLKPRAAGPLGNTADPAPYKEKSRTLAVRGKLDAIFNSKVGSMGPPKRVVSASSTGSSSSGCGTRPPSRTGMQAPSKVPEKPVASTSRLASSLTRPSSALSRSLPASTSSKVVSSTTSQGRGTPATTSSICRPTTSLVPTSTAPPRVALAPRSLITHPAKQAHTKPAEAKTARPIVPSVPRPLGVNRSISISGPAPAQVNPLKRPLAQSMSHPSVLARQAMTAGGPGRPALGLPSRLVRDPNHPRGAPMFHIGARPVDMGASRATLRSPLRQAPQRGVGTPLASRTMKLGTPSRPEGTPRSLRAKPSYQMLSTSTHALSQDISAISPSKSTGPPASSTRQALEPGAATSSDATHRGSSEDHEDVSMMLPQPPSSSPPEEKVQSPESSSSRNDESEKIKSDEDKPEEVTGKAGRPKRSTKPPPRPRTPAPPPAPYMSGKELKMTTDRNTMRNQVYFCAIDRQIVHIPGPRPPSPTSKIRTTADRDEEEKKKSREHRAKRRARESGASTEGGSPERPVVQRIEQTRGPGDDEDWKTPARPMKKAKLRQEKNVKWDRELVIVHDDGVAVKPAPSSEIDEPLQGCVLKSSMVDLDKNGNINESVRPKLDLKRSKVVVTAVFYEGEEPVPEAPPPASSSSKKKK